MNFFQWVEAKFKQLENDIAQLRNHAGVPAPAPQLALPVPPHPSIPDAPPAASTPPAGYDYSKYGPTYLDVYAAFPSGIPVDWNWTAWGAAHPGQQYPGSAPPTDTGSGNASHDGNNLDVTNPGVMPFSSGVPVSYTFTGDGNEHHITMLGVSGSEFQGVSQSTLTCNGETVFSHTEPVQANNAYNTEPFTCSGPCVYTVALTTVIGPKCAAQRI